jgi:hypothetical protein
MFCLLEESSESSVGTVIRIRCVVPENVETIPPERFPVKLVLSVILCCSSAGSSEGLPDGPLERSAVSPAV